MNAARVCDELEGAVQGFRDRLAPHVVDGVVGLALESERAAARGLSTAGQSHEALTRLAQEVQALSQLIAGLNERMRDVFHVTDAVAQIAERSRSLSAMARAQAQADGGLLAPEAFPEQ
jgi:hypothetical protein